MDDICSNAVATSGFPFENWLLRSPYKLNLKFYVSEPIYPDSRNGRYYYAA